MEKKRKGKRKEGSDQTTEEGDEVTSLKRNSRAYQKQTSSSSEEDENNGHVTKEDNKVDTAKTTYSDIILERDYSLGILTRFSTLMPQQLKNRVSEEEFEHTITTINDLFFDSESLTWANFLESFTACLSFYTYYLCITPRYTKNLKRLQDFIDNENANVYSKHGFTWMNPLHNGLLYIIILDKAGSKDE